MGIIKEFRIVLPLSVEEYQVAQLYSVAQASKNETGGGDGVEVLKNHPFTNHEQYGSGQYTYKIYHLKSKLPRWMAALAPAAYLEVHEEAWNAYPYCRTVITNPEFMKDDMKLVIETWHKPGKGEQENVHNLSKEDLAKREVDYIDIVNDPIPSRSYKEEWDPKKFHSKKTGRGPFTENWKDNADPVMCAYKLVSFHFKWWGLQNRVEKFLMKNERLLFLNFHRQVVCWLDEYYGMTMDDIRQLEDKVKDELDEERVQAPSKGTVATE